MRGNFGENLNPETDEQIAPPACATPISLHVYTHTNVCTNTRAHIHTHVYTHSCVHTGTWVHTDLHVCAHSPMRVLTHVCAQARVCTITHVCTHLTLTCMHIHPHAHVHTHSPTCAHTFTLPSSHAFTHTCMCTHIHAHPHTFTHRHTHPHTHTLTSTHIHTHPHSRVHTHMCAHAHTLTHTPMLLPLGNCGLPGLQSNIGQVQLKKARWPLITQFPPLSGRRMKASVDPRPSSDANWGTPAGNLPLLASASPSVDCFPWALVAWRPMIPQAASSAPSVGPQDRGL